MYIAYWFNGKEAVASVAPGVSVETAAAAMELASGTWRAITEAEYEEAQKPGLNESRAAAIARIDAETAAAVLAGFDHAVGGKTLHFSYDVPDQQNFADTANASLLAKMGVPGVPASVTWNGWEIEKDAGGREISRSLVRLTLDPAAFLALYMGGALAHKAEQMERGGRRKAAAGNAKTIAELEGI